MISNRFCYRNNMHFIVNTSHLNGSDIAFQIIPRWHMIDVKSNIFIVTLWSISLIAKYECYVAWFVCTGLLPLWIIMWTVHHSRTMKNVCANYTESLWLFRSSLPRTGCFWKSLEHGCPLQPQTFSQTTYLTSYVWQHSRITAKQPHHSSLVPWC